MGGTWAGACVVGDKSTHGTFDNFTETVLKPAILSYTPDDTMVATLTWPPSGRSWGGLELKMGWDGAMTSSTSEGATDVPLASHMRYDNPYVQGGGVAFPLRGAVSFQLDGKKLELDFDQGTRRTVGL